MKPYNPWLYRDARSRRQGYEYVPPPPSSKSRAAFPSQPYFKNPSFYPQEQRDKSKPLPPPPAQKIQPLPGGRLPLVQRRTTPPPFERAAARSSPPPQIRRRRTIVEETIRVTARRYYLINYLLKQKSSQICWFFNKMEKIMWKFEKRHENRDDGCVNSETTQVWQIWPNKNAGKQREIKTTKFSPKMEFFMVEKTSMDNIHFFLEMGNIQNSHKLTTLCLDNLWLG